MEGLQSLFGEQSTAVTLILIVLGLAIALVLLFWVFRRIATGNALRTGRNRQPRLSVTDAAVVDDKRRLVLVRRDTVEHLVMIGGPSDIVIEQNIVTAPPTVAIKPLDQAGTEELPERPARPAVSTEHAVPAAAAAAPIAAAATADRPSEPEMHQSSLAERTDPAMTAGAEPSPSATMQEMPPATESAEAAAPDAEGDSFEVDLSQLAEELAAPETAPAAEGEKDTDMASLEAALNEELEPPTGTAEPALQPDLSEPDAATTAAAPEPTPTPASGSGLAPADPSPAVMPPAPASQGPAARDGDDPAADGKQKEKGKETELEMQRLLDELSKA